MKTENLDTAESKTNDPTKYINPIHFKLKFQPKVSYRETDSFPLR